MDEIKAMFEHEGSIDVVKILEGHVREGEREHFGWKDGISQPALECVVSFRKYCSSQSCLQIYM